MSSLGQRIKLRRKQLGLTQKELGYKVNLTEFNVSKYEREATKPDVETLYRIAEALDCSIDYLLGKTDNKENSIVEGKYNDNVIKIEIEGRDIDLTAEEIQELIDKLGAVGFDVNKLIGK